MLVGIPEGKTLILRTRRRLEDNIKKDFQKVGWGGMDWAVLTQDMDSWRALVNAAMNVCVL